MEYMTEVSMNQNKPSRRVMILLVGGRLTPNFIGVLGYKPDAVECLVSEDEKSKYNDVLEVLSSLPRLKLPTQPRLVPAFDMQQIINACQQVINSHPEAEILFNVTCATKVMGIAAYEVAKQAKQQAIYVDTAHARFLNLTNLNEQPMPIQIGLEEYLGFYGRHPHKIFSFDKLSIPVEVALNAAAYLAEAGMAAVETLTIMRRQDRGKGRRSIKLKRLPSVEQWDVLCKLDHFGLISDLSKSPDDAVSYVITNDADWSFVDGTWLEVYVWHQATECKDRQDHPLFDECDLSMEIPTQKGARKEIDVACIYQGQLLHCSCKSEHSPFKTRHLDELRAVSSLLGGRFCSRVFVTNVHSPDEESGGRKDYQSFLQQAKDREIVVVTGDELKDIGAILRREAKRPTYWRV
jgi:hypothetical protein